MESLNRVVMTLEEEIGIVEKKLRKLRDRKACDSTEYYDLKLELGLLERAWDILVYRSW